MTCWTGDCEVLQDETEEGREKIRRSSRTLTGHMYVLDGGPRDAGVWRPSHPPSPRTRRLPGTRCCRYARHWRTSLILYITLPCLHRAHVPLLPHLAHAGVTLVMVANRVDGRRVGSTTVDLGHVRKMRSKRCGGMSARTETDC